MRPEQIPFAVDAARSIASTVGLEVDDASVVHASNRIAVRLLPCDVLARVALVGQENAEFEVEVARRLAHAEGPIAALDPRVEARPYVQDDFVVTLWTFYDFAPSELTPPADYAEALRRLHVVLRDVEMRTPHFTDRVADAQTLVRDPTRSPKLMDDDRELLGNALTELSQSIVQRASHEQLLHGEPHPGNVLATAKGLLFADLETCCCGPVEFDVAHAPEAVAEHYPDLDQLVLRECRILMLAMITAWRWDRVDRLPNGHQLGIEWLANLRVALASRRSGSPN